MEGKLLPMQQTPPSPPPPPHALHPLHVAGMVQWKIHMVPVPSQALPERCCLQPRTVLGTPAPDFSSGLTPEAFPMSGYGRKAAEDWVFPLLDELSSQTDGPHLPKALIFRRQVTRLHPFFYQ